MDNIIRNYIAKCTLSVDDTLKCLQCSRRRLTALKQEGKLLPVSKNVRYSVLEIEQFLNSKKRTISPNYLYAISDYSDEAKITNMQAYICALEDEVNRLNLENKFLKEAHNE